MVSNVAACLFILCWAFVHRKSSGLSLNDLPLFNTSAVVISIAEYSSVRSIYEYMRRVVSQS